MPPTCHIRSGAHDEPYNAGRGRRNEIFVSRFGRLMLFKGDGFGIRVYYRQSRLYAGAGG